MSWRQFGMTVVASGLVAGLQGADERLAMAEHQYRHDCASCHGYEGQGNDEEKVPALAGLPDYYVVQQMESLRRQLRALDGTDPKQLSMHQDAAELTDEEIRGMAEVIAAMAPRREFGLVPGDAERGRAIYEADCASCHGGRAEGDVAREIPPLYGFQPWYVVQQVNRFREGFRRGDAESIESLTMHALACKMWTEVDVEDVASYIATALGGGEE